MRAEADFSGDSSRVEPTDRQKEIEITSDLYAVWQPSEILGRSERKRLAAVMLNRAGVFPKKGDQCLEIGYGTLGWLSDLLSWGVREVDLHGIELDSLRAQQAQESLPVADLRVGNATSLPWANHFFKLIIVSTLFTSILDSATRRIIAGEIVRVLVPGGALLWYDFAVNSPRNPNVRKVDRRELKQLFPELRAQVKSVTLAPPLSRLVAPRSWMLAGILESIPLLRTHLVAVLVKRR